MKFLLNDAFNIIGRGTVLSCRVPQDSPVVISVGDKIGISDTDEIYEVRGIERTRLLLSSMPYSDNVGILIRGQLKQDKNWYTMKHIYKVVEE